MSEYLKEEIRIYKKIKIQHIENTVRLRKYMKLN